MVAGQDSDFLVETQMRVQVLAKRRIDSRWAALCSSYVLIAELSFGLCNTERKR